MCRLFCPIDSPVLLYLLNTNSTPSEYLAELLIIVPFHLMAQALDAIYSSLDAIQRPRF